MTRFAVYQTTRNELVEIYFFLFRSFLRSKRLTINADTDDAARDIEEYHDA